MLIGSTKHVDGQASGRIASAPIIAQPATPRRPQNGPVYTLVIHCPDRPGIVFNVGGLIFKHGGNILESRRFEGRETGCSSLAGCPPALAMSVLRLRHVHDQAIDFR